MEFDHYRNEGAQIAADLVNSLGSTSGNEYLPDPGALHQFLAARHFHDPLVVTETDLKAVRKLRTRLAEIFRADDEGEMVAKLNALLEKASPQPSITDHDGKAWHFHFTPQDASVAHRLAAVTSMGLAAVVCEFGPDRIGSCCADDCADAFVDVSRNRSRRYCSDTCSTRANVAAFRARRKRATKRKATR